MLLEHHTLLLRLVVASVLGAAIGFERDRHRRSAGLRTHMIVALAAAAFTVVSSQYAHYQSYADNGVIEVEASRIASNVVSGAGFLGGGAILRSGFTVRGLTTAAALWLVTSIGMTAGAGMFVEATAVTVLGLFALWALRPIEARGKLRVQSTISVSIAGHPSLRELLSAIEESGGMVIRHDYQLRVNGEPQVDASFSIRHEREFSTDRIVDALRSRAGAQKVRVERIG